MSQEILNSAIMQLRAKALEAYGIIKDTYRQPSKEGDADKIAALSLKLAQLEGGMLTLQQYAPEIIAAVDAELAAEKAEALNPPQDVEDLSPDEQSADSDSTISEEQLAERSTTFRKSTGTRRRKSKKKASDE